MKMKRRRRTTMMMNDRSYLRTLTDRELMELATADTELAIVLAERLEEARSNTPEYGDDA
jgi:hypothetical protein